MDPHKKAGLALLVLYVVQILLGVLVHYVKLPSLFLGYRPPHSYIHVLLGLVILALAQWQVWSLIYFRHFEPFGLIDFILCRCITDSSPSGCSQRGAYTECRNRQSMLGWLSLLYVTTLPNLGLCGRITNRMASQVFWVLYALGMAFIPRQLKQESQLRKGRKEEVNAISNN